MTVFAGVDPGLRGAIAVVCDRGRLLDVFSVPCVASGKARKAVDVYELARAVDLLCTNRQVRAVGIERVGAMPTDSRVGAFRFGHTAGSLAMAFAAHFVPSQYYSPIDWRRKLRVEGGKAGSLAMASRLWPDVFVAMIGSDDNKAEAALIAELCRRELLGAKQ